MENLKRYGPSTNKMGFGTMQRLDNGGWVKFSEVKELLQTSHNSAMDAIAILENAIGGLTSGGVRDQLLIRLEAVSQRHQ